MSQRVSMSRMAIAGTGVALGVVSPLATAVANGAPSSSGYVYTVTTGEYWPGWWADNCMKANVANDFSNQAYNYSPGRCGGTGAAMGTNWVGVDAEGYKNGAYCGDTGWAYNDSPTTTFGVGGVECAGSGAYQTLALADWWSYYDGDWMYTGVASLWSPATDGPFG